MYDNFETDLRRLIADAEADIGFDRDAPASRSQVQYHALREVMTFWTAPSIAVMRALWWPTSHR